MPEVEVGVNQSPKGVVTAKEEAPSKPKSAASNLVNGTILEAAFVHPDYTWPPVEGQGKNAIELQASSNLLKGGADDDDATTDGEREAMKMPKKPTSMRKGLLSCCASPELDVVNDYEQKKIAANKARLEYKARKKSKEREQRKKHRYTQVPEGIMIYRLDTANHTVQLMSQPSNEKGMEKVVDSMVVASSRPSNDSSRRGIEVTGIDGKTLSLVACEQRTAIAWCEAMDMMLANDKRKSNAATGAAVDGKGVSSIDCCGGACARVT
jgi:hypothetical protein